MDKFVKNITSQIFTFGIRAISDFLIIIMIAKLAGVSNLGIYSFAITFSLAARLILDLGFGMYLVREISKNKLLVNQYIVNMILILIITGPILILFTYLVSLITIIDIMKINAVTLCVIGLVFMSISSIFQTAFHAFQKMQYQTIVIFIQEFLFLSSSSIILYLKIDFIYIFSSYLFSRFIAMIFSGIIYNYKIHTIFLKFNKNFMYKLIKEALPFIANLFFTTVYARSAILVISYIMGDQATGLFEIALAFTIKGVVVSQIISKSLFPSLSNLFNVSPIDYDILSQKLIKIISIIAIVLCSIIFLYCPYIITFIISDDLSLSAIYLIRIMVVALYFKLLVIPIGDVLTTSNRQECRTKSVAIGALINIIGLFTLIPILGLTGAAITMLITEFVIFSCNFYFSIRNLKTYIIKFIFLGILNIGVAILVINLINITSLYSILLLCIIYLSMTLITNTITINEIKSLWFKILKV